MIWFLSAFGLSSVACAQWKPAVEWGLSTQTPEEAIRLGNTGFVGKLQRYGANEREASARILPTHAIWGELPDGPIEIGRHKTNQGGSYENFGQVRQDDCFEAHCGLPLMLIARKNGPREKILFVTSSYRWKDGAPITDDLLSIHDFEVSKDSPDLRRKLIDAVADPDNTELLWTYALRRLYRMENDEWNRVDLVLNPGIRGFPPSAESAYGESDRLEYAVSLLLGETKIETADYRPPGFVCLGMTYERLAEVFEKPPTPHAAEVALYRLADQTNGRAQLSGVVWGRMLRSMRIALHDPDHPIYKVPEQSRPGVNQALEDLFDEPNMLNAKKTDRVED